MGQPIIIIHSYSLLQGVARMTVKENYPWEAGSYGDGRETPPGDSPASIDLTRTLYRELHKVAAIRMAAESGPQTLEPTALVHEAWMRIGGDRQPTWASRAQFFCAAAEAMRRILVDRARRRRAIRHGGGQIRIDLEASSAPGIDSIAETADDDMLLGLHEALDQFADGDPVSAELVKLRYFAGMTVEEAANILELSKRTAERRLAFARAWLKREMTR